MYVWVILNLTPDKHYYKLYVYPGGFILHPNKPKNVDSFFTVGIYHLAALQNKRLNVWDISCDAYFIFNLHLLFTTVNSSVLVY